PRHRARPQRRGRSWRPRPRGGRRRLTTPARRPHRARLPVDVEASRMSSAPGARGDTDDGPVFTVEGGRPLVGRVRVPGDKSVSHRALLLGALAAGDSVLRGLSDGEDVARTAAAVRGLGARLDLDTVSRTTVISGGPAALHQPDGPMDSVAVPLRQMGATVQGRTERCLPPLTIRGGALRGIDYTTPMASAQVKSCVLLAGLGAHGDTVVREPVLTRRHTEELLTRCGASLTEDDVAGG